MLACTEDIRLKIQDLRYMLASVLCVHYKLASLASRSEGLSQTSTLKTIVWAHCSFYELEGQKQLVKGHVQAQSLCGHNKNTKSDGIIPFGDEKIVF